MENLSLIQVSNTIELLERAISIAEQMINNFYIKFKNGEITKKYYLDNFQKWEQKRIQFCLKLKENEENNFNINKIE
ncbi:hypothetical protein LNJ03_11215 [Tenacibaculum dicentrarchi]|nr:hypothetical protein [Tenacibaculum dicentrarchi]